MGGWTKTNNNTYTSDTGTTWTKTGDSTWTRSDGKNITQTNDGHWEVGGTDTSSGDSSWGDDWYPIEDDDE